MIILDWHEPNCVGFRLCTELQISCIDGCYLINRIKYRLLLRIADKRNAHPGFICIDRVDCDLSGEDSDKIAVENISHLSQRTYARG